jgi:hypothetical protein
VIVDEEKNKEKKNIGEGVQEGSRCFSSRQVQVETHAKTYESILIIVPILHLNSASSSHPHTHAIATHSNSLHSIPHPFGV